MKKLLLAIGITTALSTIAFSGVVNAALIGNAGSTNGSDLTTGTSVNGLTLQGTQLQSLKVEGGQLVGVKQVSVK